LAREAGLAAIGLTDHDTLGGVAVAQRAGATLGLLVIAGVEFSVKVEWGEAHLLGYLVPLDDPTLNGFLEAKRAARTERGRAMVEAIGRCGIALDFARVEGIAGGAALGRPHVARALMAAGVVQTYDEAFDRFLGRGRPAFVPKPLPPVDEVAAMVRSAGGITSMAHLKAQGTKRLLTTFRDQGVDAVEIIHPGHSAPVRAELERLTLELGMLRTGGSDSHGEAAVSPSHSTIGGERIPMEWVDAMIDLAASRRSRVSAAR
jgi:predicted metal-dependent phosphoesterase TrpH